MSVVITPDSVLGPFKQIEVLADRLRCDGAELPFAVLGSYQISEDDSLAPPPFVDEAKLAEEIRAERNKKLVESDWSQVVDTPQTIKDKWAPYRQQLRDLTTQPGFPQNVVWPVKPV
jgi:hypothetical protein